MPNYNNNNNLSQTKQIVGFSHHPPPYLCVPLSLSPFLHCKFYLISETKNKFNKYCNVCMIRITHTHIHIIYAVSYTCALLVVCDRE